MATVKELEARVKELEARLEHANGSSLYALHTAKKYLDKVGEDRFMASAVVVTIKSIDGKTLVHPFSIANGLRQGTIDALKAEADKSIKWAVDLVSEVELKCEK